MISSIHIKGYRCFKDFRMENLRRVNLLVGANGSGKTSALEAFYLLASQADRRAFVQVLEMRGEAKYDRDENHARRHPEVDASHLFHGRECRPTKRFEIAARNQRRERSLSVEVAALDAEERSALRSRGDEGLDPRLALRIEGCPKPDTARIALGPSGGFLAGPRSGTWHSARDGDASPATYIPTRSLGARELAMAWDSIALTEDEDHVIECLKILDRGVVRIAPQASVPAWSGESNRSGFLIKHEGFDQPVPISSMGDGIWHLLSLAIAITRCRDGFLLVDEIDAGLHYKVLPDMWKMIIAASRRLNVQVVATTHSYDCIGALAEQAHDSTRRADGPDDFVLQRIDAGAGVATRYAPAEMKIALERHLEMR